MLWDAGHIKDKNEFQTLLDVTKVRNLISHGAEVELQQNLADELSELIKSFEERMKSG